MALPGSLSICDVQLRCVKSLTFQRRGGRVLCKCGALQDWPGELDGKVKGFCADRANVMWRLSDDDYQQYLVGGGELDQPSRWEPT